MARATKRRGNRPITVGPHRLLWRIEWLRRPDPSTSPNLRFVVFSTTGGGQRLLADQLTDDSSLYLTEGYIMPRFVEGIMRAALEAGWEPECHGPDFRMEDLHEIIFRTL